LADIKLTARAHAFSFGDVVTRLKSMFGPAIKAGLSAALKTGFAASGDVITERGFSEHTDVPALPLPPQTRIDASVDNRPWRAYAMHKPIRSRVIVPRDTRTVAFPVLVTAPDDPGLRPQLYIVSDINYAGFLPQFKTRVGPWFLQGYEDIDHDFSLAINRNLYLCPVDPDKFKRGKVVAVDGPPVTGRSLESAVWLVCHGKFQGLLAYPITGAVDGTLCLENIAFQDKNVYCRNHYLPLAGNSLHSDVIVEDLRHLPPLPRLAAFRAS